MPRNRLSEALGYGRDFAQGASNAVAGNVSGPVDGISWVLRKAGLGSLIGDAPVGGSDWMAQKGLTAQPRNALAGLLGEAVGMSGPMVAAAKAPQVAAGLNQMAVNAAARPTLNPQTGAIVWHGSPHKFDAFDSSKIGTGEGAQAYGHGLYLAESPDVAKQYKAALSSRADTTIGGVPLSQSGLSDDAAGFVQQVAAKLNKGKSLDEATKALRINLQYGHPDARVMQAMQDAMDAVSRGVDRGILYKVDLPDEQIARMLDWDKPLSQQSEYVRKALEPLGYRHDAQAAASFDDALMAALEGAGPASLPKMPRNPMGSDIARGSGVFDGPAQIAKARAMREAGIPGIRYLDGGSRTAGGGTSNYVVFPGEENVLRILERNNAPIK